MFINIAVNLEKCVLEKDSDYDTSESNQVSKAVSEIYCIRSHIFETVSELTCNLEFHDLLHSIYCCAE